MKLRFIWPGKTKDEHLRALLAEYLKRLQRFVRCEVIETRDFSGSDRARIEKESAALLAAITDGSLMMLLDVDGCEWNSHELAEQVQRWENDSVKEITIVMGGQDGVSGEVEKRAQKKWRLSRLTLTHEMARVLAVEQIYRAYTINRGMPYQK
ncbi:MAG TPA: 23S rRNA (pseudouridine(1915)-N(3))-methyltransferase RlmH [Pyrinomonadaceae bacterium]|nr:23S rRNA (pseudouridine(1915)-N(3))-methyltransferase RlmH [Pyrinomonadaceae bacterium]